MTKINKLDSFFGLVYHEYPKIRLKNSMALAKGTTFDTYLKQRGPKKLKKPSYVWLGCELP